MWVWGKGKGDMEGGGGYILYPKKLGNFNFVVTLATLGNVKANMEDHVASKVNLKVGAKVTTT